jgi:pyruvate formate lyase activating enzyme
MAEVAGKARYWRPLEEQRVVCELCPRTCKIPEGGRGVCMGRVNKEGELVAENFARCISVAIDPIEKKPLYHVCPGKTILSVACNGCNLRCDFCQNWTISQEDAPTTEVTPEELVKLAKRHGSFGVAYTYTEPLVWYEYLLEAGALVRKNGLKNILVTGGIINEEPLEELLPLIDAMNIDLKSMNDAFYRDYCHIEGLEAVKRTIRMSAEACHVEVTNLIIPGLNDSEAETRELVEFIADISRDIPLHFSRYFPTHKMTAPPTPVATLKRARDIALERLHYVYVGNVGGDIDSNTYCPRDGHLLVKRTGYAAQVVGVEDGNCAGCGRKADFIWCEG